MVTVTLSGIAIPSIWPSVAPPLLVLTAPLLVLTAPLLVLTPASGPISK
jgi:hypothetical protein